jgi:NADPH-dependent 2,4-dienoyl-CoA reductase/sulfur reductase-like enzyme/peroxiredoxin family protein/rhodanese-related sulfurtransferase/TusA-related sulfurtransferase
MSTFVIVGGVAGGATAATRLRRLDEQADIVLIERGEHVSFANCGLPYHIGGVIGQRSSLLVATPESLADTYGIDVRVRQEVTAIDAAGHQVTVRDLATGSEYVQSYDSLILSPGATPVIPPLPGLDLEGVYTLRSIPDMDAIIARLADSNVRDALVVGGGFVGLEMAENLHARGLNVTIVEMLPQVMATMDPDMAALVHRELRLKNVRLALGDGLKSIERAGDGRLQVNLVSGRSAGADLVILSIGVRPESKLARDAGLDLGPRGHIIVDDQMRTSNPNIFAVGDAIQVKDPVTGRPTAVALAGPANRQARIAADAIMGRASAYRGTVGTAIAKVFDLAVASTGASSRALDQASIPYLTSITQSYDHASYYPGATYQTIKLIYSSEDGRLLGAQAIGINSVDRTIDVLATALTNHMTVYDLEHLELAYAPPYGAAKDPVNVAGYVASDRLRGDSTGATWQRVLERDPARTGILDVRTELEWDLGHIEGAVHIPQDELRARLGELDRERDWIVYCAVGQRAYASERILKQSGFRVANLSGGYSMFSIVTEQQDNWDTWAPTGAEDSSMPLSTRTMDSTLLEPAATPGASLPVVELDACGLQCPGPIMAVYTRMQQMTEGQRMQVLATDPGFVRDIATWAQQTGNSLLDLKQEKGRITALLAKGKSAPELRVSATGTLPHAKTIIVFNGNLDNAMAAMIIANGAAAMGQPVSMFFTFWGLNMLRRAEAVKVNKTLIERMFGWMMPRGANRFKLSSLNMAGMGTAMMKMVIKSKNIDSLESLIKSAQEAGVKMIACQMTMDMMGIKPEELIDGVEIGGVATMIGETDKGNATWFI